MLRNKSALAVIAFVAALASAPAAAQIGMSSAYVGGSLGQSDAKDACEGVPGCDEKDTAWKIFGGFQLTPMFAVELGYTDLGEVSAPGVSAEATAWDLSVLASFPIGESFSLYGRLGGYRAETEGRVGALTVDDSNTGLTFGVGAAFALSRNLGLRAEWQRYADVGDDDAESDVDVLSIGVMWRF
jgi:OmpA-OmpF porin, OOP family